MISVAPHRYLGKANGDVSSRPIAMMTFRFFFFSFFFVKVHVVFTYIYSSLLFSLFFSLPIFNCICYIAVRFPSNRLICLYIAHGDSIKYIHMYN